MKESKKHYVRLGLTIFLSLAAAIAFFFLIFHFQGVKDFFGLIGSALKPAITGAVLAYLLCPLTKLLERQLSRCRVLSGAARLLSVLLTLVLVFCVLGLFCALLLPQLVENVRGLVTDLPGLLEGQIARLGVYLKEDNEAAAAALQMIESVETSLAAWIKTNLLSTISTVAGSILSLGSALVNLVVSLVVTIYLLLGREHYSAQCRKLFLAVSRKEEVNRVVFETLAQINRIFSGFISGKLLDSLIVGIICFVCLLLLRIPYALLISVIVGVTNIIPMFGPFIGAVPSAFLLLLVSPKQCIVFLIFIIVLQQADGNIIGPRILGNSTGLSAIYVTIAMLLFGKLMGFPGMIVGVPLFATMYYIVKRLAEYSLRKQGKPVETAEYETKEAVGEQKAAESASGNHES